MSEFRESKNPQSLSGMNESQRQAVTHGEGPLLLLAGPGSGKTFTITNRILYLLKQGVLPEAILVITFTKEAAMSMQHRFQELSSRGGAISQPVNFGTFHSVFYHILKESHLLKSTNLLNLSEKKNLLIPILKDYVKQHKLDQSNRQEDVFASLNEDAIQILSAISFYKNTMQLSAACSKAPARWQTNFDTICQEYENAVRSMGRIDFDDMLYNCKKLLEENKVVRNYWQERFCHILIDEFQDINPVQYEVVKLLTAIPYNLFAVGDDDQAIYGFRGSEPDCLRRFGEEFHARQLILDVNYRSKPGIVKASLAVIKENKNRFEKQLKAVETINASLSQNMAPSTVVLRPFTDRESQCQYMLQALQAQTKESCAVLFRTNSYMQSFAARLKAADIPYEMREKASSIYRHFIVEDIMSYLQIAQGESRREQMLRIMNKPFRHIGRDAIGEGPVNLKKVWEYYNWTQIPQSQKSEIQSALSQLERQLQSICKLSLLPAVNYILKAVGYEQYLREQARLKPEKWQEWQEILEWLKEDAARFGSLRDWKAFQEEYTKALEQGRPVNGKMARPVGHNSHGDCSSEKQAVQLLTVHGAKGLEFDRVWIPDCNEKVFPHGKMPDEKSVEEERRIFYVAMTRAKNSLELLYLTGTKERPKQSSRFLNPLCTL